MAREREQAQPVRTAGVRMSRRGTRSPPRSLLTDSAPPYRPTEASRAIRS